MPEEIPMLYPVYRIHGHGIVNVDQVRECVEKTRSMIWELETGFQEVGRVPGEALSTT